MPLETESFQMARWQNRWKNNRMINLLKNLLTAWLQVKISGKGVKIPKGGASNEDINLNQSSWNSPPQAKTDENFTVQ